MNDISIVISTRDRPDALDRCLAALGRGDVLPAEVVIVDQGEIAPVLRVVERHREAGLPIRHLPREPNGLAAAQNAGVDAARGEFVAVTDDDCVPDRRWLSVLSRRFASLPRVDLIAGRVLPAGADGAKRHTVSTRTSTTRREFRGRAAPWHVGSGNNFAFRRAAYLEVGGCDERLGPGSPGKGGVDMDLFYRFLRSGARVLYEPDAVVLHDRQTESERRDRRRWYGYGMGACCGLWLRGGDPSAARILAQWVLLRVVRMLRPADGEWARAFREELSVLRGTVGGLAYGLRVPDRSGRPPAPGERGSPRLRFRR